jgi:phage-related protein
LWADEGTFRVIYLARREEAFQKKAKATAQRDLDPARKRYAELQRMSR